MEVTPARQPTNRMKSDQLNFVDWGLVPYNEKSQLDLISQIAKGEMPETIVFCSHNPVVTLGRKSDRTKDLIGWTGEVAEVRRGGKATYHGPGQLVMYPLFDLRKKHQHFGVQDVMGLIKFLENTVVEVLAEYGLHGVPGHHKSVEFKQSSAGVSKEVNEQHELMTGVWVNNKKICSLGIAVSQWISFHGIALNVNKDPLAFTGINPCGFSKEVMTDLEAELSKKINLSEITNHLKNKLKK